MNLIQFLMFLYKKYAICRVLVIWEGPVGGPAGEAEQKKESLRTQNTPLSLQSFQQCELGFSDQSLTRGVSRESRLWRRLVWGGSERKCVVPLEMPFSEQLVPWQDYVQKRSHTDRERWRASNTHTAMPPPITFFLARGKQYNKNCTRDSSDARDDANAPPPPSDID